MHVQDSPLLKLNKPWSEDLHKEHSAVAGRPDEQHPVELCLGERDVALKDGKGFSSVRVGSLAEKDTQLYAATYSAKHLNKQRLPGGAGLSVNKSC